MKIIELDVEKYKNAEIMFEYTTQKFLEFENSKLENGYSYILNEKKLQKPVLIKHKDKLFTPELINPVCFACVIDDINAGIIQMELLYESRRLRIDALSVKKEFRRKGIGTLLIDIAKETALQEDMRMIYLETQSCNVDAVKFYIENGFEISGFDLFAYSNNDLEKKFVKIRLAYLLNK